MGIAEIISALATIAATAYQFASTPDMPSGSNMSASSRAGVQASAETLPILRQMQAAAAQGGKFTYVNQPESRSTTHVPYVHVDGKTVPFISSEWSPGGVYYDRVSNGQPFPKISWRKEHVKIDAGLHTVDFGGFSDADVQGAQARALAKARLELEQKYGPQFIEVAKQQLEEGDPLGTAARGRVYDLLQEQMNAKPDRPVADLLDRQVGEELAAGKGLDTVSREMLDRAVTEAQASRGQSAADAGAAWDEPLTTGQAGADRASAARRKALAWLTSGATPEDVEYRRNQQNMADLAAFIAGQTPQSQFANLSGAQAGPAPFYSGQQLPRMDPNAGQSGTSYANRIWGLRLDQASQQADPWMAGLSMAIRGSGVAQQFANAGTG